jgi:tetratricopeptide (TPR) repeat protein
MPSHIFTRLGLWDRSIASNHDSTRSATAYTRQAHLPGHYDEGIHSIDYLLYAYLQVADDEAAKSVLEGLRDLDKAHPETFKVAYTYAASPARYALERRQWVEASELPLVPENFPWAQFTWAVSIHHFARGIGAARSGNVPLAKQELRSIETIGRELPGQTLKYWREEVGVHADAVAAWIAFAEGDTDGALALAERAADTEDAVDKHPVTPGEVVPARELLADLLQELGRPAEARRQYERVLDNSPNRLNAMLGAAEASAQQGDAVAAMDYYRAALEQTRSGTQQRERLGLAKAFVHE